MYYNYNGITITNKLSPHGCFIIRKYSDNLNDWAFIRRYTFNVSPEIKNRYKNRIQKDILNEIVSILNEINGLEDIKISRSSIYFNILGPKGMQIDSKQYLTHIKDIENNIIKIINEKRITWDNVVKDRDGLQGLLLNKLTKDKEFELNSFIHYASKYGYENAFNLKTLIETWK